MTLDIPCPTIYLCVFVCEAPERLTGWETESRRLCASTFGVLPTTLKKPCTQAKASALRGCLGNIYIKENLTNNVISNLDVVLWPTISGKKESKHNTGNIFWGYYTHKMNQSNVHYCLQFHSSFNRNWFGEKGKIFICFYD